MKKLLYILPLTLAMASCSTQEEPFQEENTAQERPSIIIYASNGVNRLSRTQVENVTNQDDGNRHILWSSNDKIGVMYGGWLKSQILGYLWRGLNVIDAFDNRAYAPLEIAPFNGEFTIEDQAGLYLTNLQGAYGFQEGEYGTPTFHYAYYPFNDRSEAKIGAKFQNSLFSVNGIVGQKLQDFKTLWNNDDGKYAYVDFNIPSSVTIENYEDINSAIAQSDIKVAKGARYETTQKNYTFEFWPLISLLEFDFTSDAVDTDLAPYKIDYIKIESIAKDGDETNHPARNLTGKYRFNFLAWGDAAEGQNDGETLPDLEEMNAGDALHELTINTAYGAVSGQHIYGNICPTLKVGDMIKMTLKWQHPTHPVITATVDVKKDFERGRYYRIKVNINQSELGTTWTDVTP